MHSTVCALVHFFDTDGDAKLSQDEFLSMMAIVNDCVNHGRVRTKTKSGRHLLDLEKKMSKLAEKKSDVKKKEDDNDPRGEWDAVHQCWLDKKDPFVIHKKDGNMYGIDKYTGKVHLLGKTLGRKFN